MSHRLRDAIKDQTDPHPRRERLDREKMVEGMAASVRASEEEKEEDAAFEAEYAEAEAARRARRK